MAANDNPEGGEAVRNAASFAARHPDLGSGQPEAFLKAAPSRSAFDQARDPLIKVQIEDLKKTEAQRREEGGRGSNMVRQDRPKVEAKPDIEFADGAVRVTFNAAWLREQREARIAQYKEQRAERSRQGGREVGYEKQRSQGPQR